MQRVITILSTTLLVLVGVIAATRATIPARSKFITADPRQELRIYVVAMNHRGDDRGT